MINMTVGINGVGAELTSCLRKSGVIEWISESPKGEFVTIKLELEQPLKIKREEVLDWLKTHELLSQEAETILENYRINTFYLDPEAPKVKKAQNYE